MTLKMAMLVEIGEAVKSDLSGETGRVAGEEFSPRICLDFHDDKL